MRTSEDADKPPNAGSVKKRHKGTITINADRQTKQTKEQETTASEETKVTASTKTNTNIKTNEVYMHDAHVLIVYEDITHIKWYAQMGMF